MSTLLDQLSPETRAELLHLLQQTTPTSGSEKTILIDGNARRQLEKLFGRNISTVEDVIKNVEHALELEIDGIILHLTPQLLDRLKTRCIGMSMDRFLPWIIQRELESYCGLR